MRLNRGVVVLVGLVLPLAGCSALGSAPTPVRTSSPAVTAVAASASPVATLPVPGRLPGEVARTVVTTQMDDATTGTFPRTAHRLYLHLRCTGPAGTVMRYRLERADGRAFGPSGDWTCDRTGGLIGDESVGSVAGGVQVRLQADAGVTTAWAVVSTSAEGG